MKHNITLMTLQMIPSIDCTYVNRLSSIDFSFVRQPKLHHLVLCVCECVERMKWFLKGVGKV